MVASTHWPGSSSRRRSSPSSTPLPATRASRRSDSVTRSARTTSRPCSVSPVLCRSTSSSSGPKVPLVAGLADVLRSVGISGLRPVARGGGDRGLEDVREGGHGGCGRADGGDARRADRAVRAQGRRAGRRQGRRRAARRRTRWRPGSPSSTGSPARSSSRSCSKAPRSRSSRSATAPRRWRSPLAQDFKRADDGDRGPNTGGMGSFAPVPGVGDEEVEELVELTCRPVLAELATRGRPFVGTLFAGLMLTPAGPRVLEYNCRFGDPETQSLLPLVDGDLLAALAAAPPATSAASRLGRMAGAAVTVVLAAGDYPAGGDRGSRIDGIDAAEATGALVFHAGTALRDGAVVTNGGRILNVTGVGDDLAAARAAAYAAADLITWDGCPSPRGHRPRREPVGCTRARGAGVPGRRSPPSPGKAAGRAAAGAPLEWACDRSLLPPGHEPASGRTGRSSAAGSTSSWRRSRGGRTSGSFRATRLRAIREQHGRPTPERVAEIERETNHDVAAFVDAVSEELGEDGRWFHYGLTSSDVLDTALSLDGAGGGCARPRRDRALVRAVVVRAEEHRETPSMGRTHGVHAEPTTFGLKLAGWAFALDRDRERLVARDRRPARRQALRRRRHVRATEPEVERRRLRATRAGAGTELDPDPAARPARRAALGARSARLVARPVRHRDSPSRRGRRCARSRSRSGAARRARRRCRTSATRSRPSASAGSRGSCGRTRSSGSRTSRSGTSGTSRTRRPSASCSPTRSSPSTTCSTGSPGSSRAWSCARSGCARTLMSSHGL